MKKRLGFFALLSALVLPLSISAMTLDKDTTLTDNVNDGILVKKGSKVTLNLGGKKVTNKDGEHTITVEDGATLTIIGEGSATNTSNDRAVLANDGTLIIKGGTYSRVETKTPDVTYYVFLNHGTATIDGGTFKIDSTGVDMTDKAAKDGLSSLIDNGWYNEEENVDGKKSVLTINDGEFIIANNDKYIKNDSFGTMTVNGGTFTTSAYPSAVLGNMAEDAVLTVNGGIFNHGRATEPIWCYKGKTIINGGIYNLVSDKININDGGELKIEFKKYKISGSEKTSVINEEDIKEIVNIADVKEADIYENALKAIKAATNGKYTLASFYEINLYKGLDEDTLFEGTEMEASDTAKVITLKIPTSLKAVQDGYKRTYYVVRSHMVDNEYKVDVLDTTLNEDGTVSFKTDKFSSYALAYTDTKVEKTEVKNPNTADNGLLYMVLSGLGLVSIAFVSKSLIKH